MNAPLSSRTLSNNQTSYQKLALKLSPGTTQAGIIRISAKGTPTTNSEGLNSTLYNRITRHDNNNHSLPTKTSIASLKTSLSKDYNNVSGRLIRSQVTTSTRNWEAECGVLKQTLDYYKNRMIELQNKHSTNKTTNTSGQQSSTFQQILQETQLRMSEQNAYLRDCMAKLNEQLEHTKQSIPWLQNNITQLEGMNNILSKDLKQKQNNLKDIEKAYKSLIQHFHDQKSFGQNVNNKLIQLQHHIKTVQQQNKKVNQQLSKHQKISVNLQSFLQEQRTKNKLLLQDCLSMQNQVSSHKKHINELQDTVNKLNQQNKNIKKSEQNYGKKSLFQTKSVRLTNKSFEIQQSETHNSCIFKQNKSLTDSLEFKRSYSTAVVQEVNGYQQFDNKTFEQKTEEFRLLKTYVNLQNTSSSQSITQLLKLAQYFKQFVSVLIADKSRLQTTIQKYKKFVQISWQNPSISTQAKSQQFVIDLIDKCNLYQSSLCQKKNTIKYLQHQLDLLKKQSKATLTREHKQRYSYLDRQDQIQKQKIIMTKVQKDISSLSKQLIQPIPDILDRKVSSLNSSSKSLHGLDKIKSFKIIASSAKKQQNEKLKNISGQQIFKKMETKLKFYEGEVVPELQAKVSQYKGMLDSFEREISNQQSLEQSRIRSVLNTQRVPAKSNLKRRKNVNSVIFDDFKQHTIKQSQIFRTQITDLGITKQKKKRFDELRTDVSIKLLAAVTLRLCQIARKMIKNQNSTVILPQSIYLMNYSDQYVGSLKVKILETPKNRQMQIRKYWAPQNIQGVSFSQLSLVWNLGILIDQLIHGQLFFKNQEQIMDIKLHYKCLTTDKPFFKVLLEKMLQKDSSKRILLKHIQTQILQEQESLFN